MISKKINLIVVIIITLILLVTIYTSRTIYIDGEIISIQDSDIDKYEVMIEVCSGNKIVLGYLDDKTYIGNATKSPPK